MTDIILAAAVFGGDQAVKRFMEKKLNFHEEKPVCNGFVTLTKHHNSGSAGNCFQGKKDLLIAISSAILGGVCVLLAMIKKRQGKGYLKLAYSLILGGGLSNLYDRLTLGYVVDYFRFSKMPRPIRKLVFNFADLAVFLGGFLALLGNIGFSEEVS